MKCPYCTEDHATTLKVERPLREATDIGQITKGTSKGSKYCCVAIGERIKIAVRVTAKEGKKAISIRAEWDPADTSAQLELDLEGLRMAGLSIKAVGYASVHIQVETAFDLHGFLAATFLPFNSVVEV